MPTIDNLSSTSSLSSGDLVPVYSQANGDARKASLSTLLAFFQSQFASPEFETVTAAPSLAGFTAALVASAKNIWLILSPTGPLASGTVVLPAPADSFDGQTIVVVSSEAITVLTVNGNGGTVNGAPTSLGTDGFFSLRYQALTSTWWCTAQSLGATTTFSDIVITGSILSGDSETMLAFTQNGAGTAVNYPTIRYGISGKDAEIGAAGSDVNIGVALIPKGSGDINLLASTGDVNIGSGGVNNIVASGAAGILITGATTVGITATTGNATVDASAGNVLVRAYGAGNDVTISSDLDDIFLNAPNGDVSVAGRLRATQTFVVAPTVVASLPAAASSEGYRAFVTDSNAAVSASIGVIVVGGGSTRAPVYSDGTNWRVG